MTRFEIFTRLTRLTRLSFFILSRVSLLSSRLNTSTRMYFRPKIVIRNSVLSRELTRLTRSEVFYA